MLFDSMLLFQRINCKNEKGNNYSLYKEVEKDIVLSSLVDMNIKELIKELIERFK